MKHKYLRNVATLELDFEKCTGCGKCSEVCPHGVFSIVEHKAVIGNKDACMECGACSLNCPFSALSVKPGVGCAAAIIKGMLTGTEPECGCSGSSGSGCCS
ncbi:MAG TPA: mercury methylation ferredoxin HgcB [Clostridia bacterium]|nr:mercury methylation ferredoxin HgcB [Clostridia bacterium]